MVVTTLILRDIPFTSKWTCFTEPSICLIWVASGCLYSWILQITLNPWYNQSYSLNVWMFPLWDVDNWHMWGVLLNQVIGSDNQPIKYFRVKTWVSSKYLEGWLLLDKILKSKQYLTKQKKFVRHFVPGLLKIMLTSIIGMAAMSFILRGFLKPYYRIES